MVRLLLSPHCVSGYRQHNRGNAVRSSVNATVSGDLQATGKVQGDTGVLPLAVLQAVTAVQYLWVGSVSVMSVSNIYTALQVYNERKSIDKTLADAFVRSRIIALEEAQRQERNPEALVEIFSVDSLSALRTLADTTSRIAEICAADGLPSGAALMQQADHIVEVHDALNDKVCAGLMQEVTEASWATIAAAQKYWKGVPDKSKKFGFQQTLFYEHARRKNKVYNRDFLNEFDNGVAANDEIVLEDFGRDCQPRDLNTCSADNAAADDPRSSMRPRGLSDVLEFEQTTSKMKLLLQGLHYSECPVYVFDECVRRAMLCTYGARTMLQSLDEYWATQETAAAEEVDGAATTVLEDSKEANASPTKPAGLFSRFLHYVRAFKDSDIKKQAGLLSLGDAIANIAIMLFRFHERIGRLLRGVGLDAWKLKQVYNLLWTHGLRQQGNFIQRFLGDKVLTLARGKLTEALPGIAVGIAKGQIPKLATWLHTFSWLAIKRAKEVNIAEACDAAAQSLQNHEIAGMAKAKEMAMESLADGL